MTDPCFDLFQRIGKIFIRNVFAEIVRDFRACFDLVLYACRFSQTLQKIFCFFVRSHLPQKTDRAFF